MGTCTFRPTEKMPTATTLLAHAVSYRHMSSRLPQPHGIGAQICHAPVHALLLLVVPIPDEDDDATDGYRETGREKWIDGGRAPRSRGMTISNTSSRSASRTGGPQAHMTGLGRGVVERLLLMRRRSFCLDLGCCFFFLLLLRERERWEMRERFLV